jgi:hypothetical protein
MADNGEKSITGGPPNPPRRGFPGGAIAHFISPPDLNLRFPHSFAVFKKPLGSLGYLLRMSTTARPVPLISQPI